MQKRIKPYQKEEKMERKKNEEMTLGRKEGRNKSKRKKIWKGKNEEMALGRRKGRSRKNGNIGIRT